MSATQSVAAQARASRLRRTLQAYKVETAMAGALVLICLVLGVATSTFATVGNLRNLLWQATALGIIALGQTLVILTAGIDLSVGGIAAFSAMIGGMVMLRSGVAAGVVTALVTGAAIGMVNGLLVSYARLAPFVVTLGMFSITHSLTYVVSDARSLVKLPQAYDFFGNARVGGIPFYIFIFVALYIATHILLVRTKFGRFVYALGSNEEAARLSGVNVRLYKTLAYVITGVLCAIAVIILTSNLGAVDPDTGAGFDLDSIAAVVIGGTSLFGGKGSVIGTFIGVILMTVLHNGLNLIGVSPFWQGSAVGAVIILSVLLERLFRRYG